MNTELIKKLEESIDLIRSGCFLKIDEFVIGSQNNRRLQVNSYLPYNKISEVPKEILYNELEIVKEKFSIILNESQIFKEFATNAGIDYYLVLDYQSGGVSLCAEIEGVYKQFI